MFSTDEAKKFQLPPAAIASLRSHSFAVTSIDISHNYLLVSADEGGWVIVWSLSIRRPLAVFKPHDKSIIKAKWVEFPSDKRLLLMTHGRDNKLKVFHYDMNESYTTTLPTQKSDPTCFKSPWQIHSQDVNALNFCAVAVQGHNLALPNTLSSQRIDIYQIFPEFVRLFFGIDPDNPSASMDSFSEDRNRGIVMALILTETRLVAGYESGEVAFYQIDMTKEKPHITLLSVLKSHKQPVLSLANDLSSDTVLSISADSHIVKYDINTGTLVDQVNTKHTGLGHIAVRSDGKIFATAGWDGFIRVFDLQSMGYLSSFKCAQKSVKCVVFSPIKREKTASEKSKDDNRNKDSSETDGKSDKSVFIKSLEITKTKSAGRDLSQRLMARTADTHWLAVGRADGVVDLFNIY